MLFYLHNYLYEVHFLYKHAGVYKIKLYSLSIFRKISLGKSLRNRLGILSTGGLDNLERRIGPKAVYLEFLFNYEDRKDKVKMKKQSGICWIPGRTRVPLHWSHLTKYPNITYLGPLKVQSFPLDNNREFIFSSKKES